LSIFSPITFAQWSASGSNIFYNSGSVGVGTSSPAALFHVSGGDSMVDTGHYMLFGQSAWGIQRNGSTGNLDFVYSVPRLSLNPSGNIGIGTAYAPAKLEIDTAYDVPAAPALRINSWVDMNSSACGLAAIGSNVYLSNDNYFYYSNTHGSAGGTAIMFRDCGNDYQAIKFLTAPGATTANAQASLYERMRITSAGNVGIGTSNPQYLLSVRGTIGAQEVVVTNTGWSDYVFRPDYHLRPLAEVKTYIQEHRHLPDIPSESEVKEKGVSVGEMQSKLLAKVEELTLHLIQAEERNQELQARIARLEKAVAVAASDAVK
jgi:hypothetical protein